MFTLIARLIQATGIVGVFLLMLVENVIPVIPSEVILPMAGYEAEIGRFNPLLAAVVGAAGSALGSLAWFALGRWIGLERLLRWTSRHGRWLALSTKEMRLGNDWFQRFGPVTVAVGRALPGVRGVIAIPAGVAGMSWPAFLISCSIGSLAWSALLVYAGFALGKNYQAVEHWINPVTDVFLGLCVAGYIYRVATFRRREAREAKR